MNIPNALSILRILLIPLYAWVYFAAPEVAIGEPVAMEYIWAAVILLVSGLTDLFDGMIARRFNMITKLGRFLDPCADKLTQATVTVLLAIRHPEWIVLPILYIGKELLMLIGGMILMRKFKDIAPSRWYGKLATGIFYGAMILLVAFPMMPMLWSNILVVLTIVSTVFAFAMYFPLYFKLYRKQQPMVDEKQKAHSSEC